MVNVLFRNTLNGGDIAVSKNGIERGDFLQTAVYCALFGGNIEEDSKREYRRYEKNLSFWGNTFLQRQFNSQTERAIRQNVATQDGLMAIRRAIIADLQKLIPNEIDGITEVCVVKDEQNPKRIKVTIYLEAKRLYRTFEYEVEL